MLRSTCNWVSAKKPKVIDTSWNRVTQRPDAELPFEPEPDVDGDAEHREADRQAPSHASSSLTLPETVSTESTRAPG